MASLYLRAWGGLGARINVVLSALYGLDSNQLPHKIKLNWPMVTEADLQLKGPRYWNDRDIQGGYTENRERLFGASLQDLYDIDTPIEYISSSEFDEAASKHLYYDLDYTQAPQRNPLFRGQVHFASQPHDEDFAVDGHQWMNIDGLHYRVLPRFKHIYERYFSLKPDCDKVSRDMLRSLNEHTIGICIRSATTHPSVGPWDAASRMRKMMRTKLASNSKHKFFVSADDPTVLQQLKQEFPGKILHTIKPGKFNDSAEMRCVTADIEIMKNVRDFYPTWGSGLAILMAALRGCSDFDRYGNTTKLGGANFVKLPEALCRPPGDPLVVGGWIFDDRA